MSKNTRGTAVTEERETRIDGQMITYTLRRSLKASRVRLEISRRTGLIVVVPRSYPLGRLPELLKSKEKWIARNLAKLKNSPPTPIPRELKPGDALPFFGRELQLVKNANHDGECVVMHEDRLSVCPDLFENGLLEPALERWYRTEADRLLRHTAQNLSLQLKLSYNRLVIRGQRTRWGSCSRRKNLSFNWKVIMAPEPVVEYVVIHELLHLKQMNHSKKFWELVARYCPEWRQHKSWLKQHETELTGKLGGGHPSQFPHQLRLI